MTDISRRTFLETGTALAGTAAMAGRAFAQSQVTIPSAPAAGAIATGVIGTGGRGTADLGAVLEHGKVLAVCDVKADRVKAAADLAARDKPASYADYRRVLE